MSAIPPVPIVESEGRTSSPARISRGNTPLKQRILNPTPDKRSISASKAAQRIINNNGIELKRSSSTRRVRRWENANLFGLPSEIHQQLLVDYMESEGKETQRSAFNAETKSAFQEMFEAKNLDILERFRKGEEIVLFTRKSKPKSSSSSHNHLIQDALKQVEKRLRSILLEKVAKSPVLLEFLYQLELVFFAYINSSLDAYANVNSPEYTYWQHYVQSPITVPAGEKKELQIHLQKNSSWNSPSSSLLPLIIHAAGHFYQLSSRSYQDAEGYKVMLLKVYAKKGPSVVISEKVSLAQWLVQQQHQKKSKVVSPGSSPNSVVDNSDKENGQLMMKELEKKMMTVNLVRSKKSCVKEEEEKDKEEDDEFVIVDYVVD